MDSSSPAGVADARGPIPARIARHHLLAASGLYCALALAVSPIVYLQLLLDYLAPMVGIVFYAMPLLVAMVAIAANPRMPFAAFRGILRVRGGRILATIAVVPLFLAAFTTLKLHVPTFNGFPFDPALAAIDEALHGGEPWRFLHALPSWIGRPIDVIYGPAWFATEMTCLLLALATIGRDELTRLLWTKLLAMVLLGTVLATLAASVGPVFYQDFHDANRFSGLREAIDANPALRHAALYANYLLASHSGEADIGTGISAMPSIHVALATIVAWQLTGYGRAWAVLGWTYAAAILFGSVYLGWHYAVDGYVSLAAVSAVWLVLSRRLALPLVGSGGWLAPLRIA